RLDEAGRDLDAVGEVPGFSGWVLAFLRADLARRRGERWADRALEGARPERCRPGHPFAFYFQATARQPGRADAPERPRLAAAFLRADAGGHPHNICELFAACVDLLAAALAGDGAAWADAAGSVRHFLAAPAAAPLGAHYAPALAALGDTPDAGAAESFL